jgi:tRNA-2-methylthio-N6-dimethylallyladenosine synthase
VICTDESNLHAKAVLISAISDIDLNLFQSRAGAQSHPKFPILIYAPNMFSMLVGGMEKRGRVRTYGCRMNKRDSEGVKAGLGDCGHEIAGDDHGADITHPNACGVREQAEAKAIGKLNPIGKNREKCIGIMGCMAQNPGKTIHDQLIRDPHRRITDPAPQVIDRPFVAVHDAKKVQASAFVSMIQRCNMHCAYRVAPKTRGREQYRSIEDIVDEVRSLAERRAQEMTFLGQIVNHYSMVQMPFISGNNGDRQSDQM